jgi:peptidyl-prolyl cis-trans isomerase C
MDVGPFQVRLAPALRRRLAVCLMCIGAIFLPAAVFAQTAPVPSSSVLQPKAVPSGSPPAATPPDAPAGDLGQLADQFDKTPDTVVADVNGTPITLGMVADRLRSLSTALAALPSPTVYRIAVDDLIQQRSLAVKAKELGLDKDAGAKRRVEEATDEALAGVLVRHILPEMVTDKTIGQLYDAMIAGKPGPEEVQIRIIATASEAEASTVLATLAKGGNFAAVARESSRDPSAAAGGEIGYASREKLTPEIGAVAFALAPGQINAYPVLSNGLWFAIQVEGRRQQAAPSLASAREKLASMVTRQAIAEIIKKTRASVVVKDYGPTGMRGRDTPSAGK